MSLTITLPTVNGDNGAWGAELNAILTALNNSRLNALRTTDNSAISSATLVSDPILQLTLDVGTWDIDVRLLFTGGTSAADLKTAWAFGGTASTSFRGCLGPSSAATSALANGSVLDAAAAATATTITASVVYGVDGTNISMALESGSIVVTAAGVLAIQIANNAGAGSLTLKGGSRLRAIKVAS